MGYSAFSAAIRAEDIQVDGVDPVIRVRSYTGVTANVTLNTSLTTWPKYVNGGATADEDLWVWILSLIDPDESLVLDFEHDTTTGLIRPVISKNGSGPSWSANVQWLLSHVNTTLDSKWLSCKRQTYEFGEDPTTLPFNAAGIWINTIACHLMTRTVFTAENSLGVNGENTITRRGSRKEWSVYFEGEWGSHVFESFVPAFAGVSQSPELDENDPWFALESSWKLWHNGVRVWKDFVDEPLIFSDEVKPVGEVSGDLLMGVRERSLSPRNFDIVFTMVSENDA